MSNQSNNIKFAAWMAGPIGRVARIAIGAVLVIIGVAMGGTGGVIVGLIGLVPVGLGVSNRCIISKAIGAPWKGEDAMDLVGS
jgi:Inner membrane protein YgaP-like, transmembrane domain